MQEDFFRVSFSKQVEEYFTVSDCNSLNRTADNFWHQGQVHVW